MHTCGNATEWRPVVGFDGSYEVSCCGRVRGVDRYVTCSDGRVRFIPGAELKVGRNSIGYGRVALCEVTRG